MDISLEQRSRIVRGFAADPPRGRPNVADARSRLRSLRFEVLVLISRHERQRSRGRLRKTYSLTALFPYSPNQLLIICLCSSPTWWLWRSGCTRSHSELGRETLLRQWYFVLRHGRVGRCQVCKAHKSKSSSQIHTKQTFNAIIAKKYQTGSK